MISKKLTTLMMLLLLAGMAVGVFIRPLLVPWMISSALFLVNYFLSLIFIQAASRLSPSNAAGVAVLSFMLRLGLMGMGLLAVALALPDYLLVSAICFLTVYTLLMALEVTVGIRGRAASGSTTAGGEA